MVMAIEVTAPLSEAEFSQVEEQVQKTLTLLERLRASGPAGHLRFTELGSRLSQIIGPAHAETQQFDPVEQGRILVNEMRAAEGGAWTGNELKELFKLDAATLHSRRKGHRIISWRDPKNNFHYPKWQFNPAGALLPGIQEVLQIFKSHDEWRIVRYFLGHRDQLCGRRPLDLLREGDTETALKHAYQHAEENTW